MASEWKISVTSEEDKMIKEVQAARMADPDGPAPTKTAIIRAGVRMIWKKEVQGS